MSDFGWGLVLLGAYVLLVMLARWIYIARTNVIWTNAQAAAMAKRLSVQVEAGPSGGGQAQAMQSTMRRLLKKIRQKSPRSVLSGIVGWNGSRCPRLTVPSWSPGWSGRWDSWVSCPSRGGRRGKTRSAPCSPSRTPRTPTS